MSRLSDDETIRTADHAQGRISVQNWGAHSDIGLVRNHNEDAWGERDRKVFVVADGMGGTSGGALASSLAVAGFLAANPNDGRLTSMQELSRSIHLACRQEGYANAGTTLVGLFIDADRCVTINIGDSRIYRLRENSLETLTIDHNLANLRREEGGSPTDEDGRGRPSALTSFLGSSDPDQRIDIRTIAINDGDRLLLCSDGVHGQVRQERVAELVGLGHNCEDASRFLTSEAAAAGGRDNATALTIDLAVTPS